MKCEICGREYKKLGRHLKSKHDISSKVYYDKYLKRDGDGFCVVCGKPTNFTRISMGGYPSHCLSCVSKDPSVKRKKEWTCLSNYGSINPMKVESIKKKYKKNNFEKYGLEWPMERSEVRSKSIETCIERYGVENVNQLDSVRIKKEKTNLKNWGVRYPTQSEQILRKSRKTCQIRYGTDHYFQTSDGRQISRESFIKSIENQKLHGEPLTPRIGFVERQCLDELQKYSKFDIIRNSKIIGYFPDGYIKELNLVIEFDERYHFVDEWKTYSRRDIQKDKDYKKEGFVVLRIKKLNWEQNQNNIIDKFKMILEKDYV